VEVPLISKGILKIPSKGDIEGYFLGHWNEIVKLKYLITNENLSIFFDDLSKLVTIGTTLIPNADDIDYDFQTYEVEAKPFFNYDDKIVDDRNAFYLNKTNRLYFYSKTNGEYLALDNDPTCTIDGTPYTVIKHSKGIYYIELFGDTNVFTDNTEYRDI
jgi:hypothetical protein